MELPVPGARVVGVKASLSKRLLTAKARSSGERSMKSCSTAATTRIVLTPLAPARTVQSDVLPASTAWRCLISAEGKRRFLPYDAAANTFGSFYHIRVRRSVTINTALLLLRPPRTPTLCVFSAVRCSSGGAGSASYDLSCARHSPTD